MKLSTRYLQVTLDLPNNDHQSQMFEQYMRELMPTFTNTPWPGWDLFLSAKRQPDRDPASEPSDAKRYLHLWRVRDYNSLPYLMEEFDDNEVYRNLDAMVLTEIQDFAGSLPYNPQTVHPSFRPPPSRYYLHLTTDMVQNPEALEAFEQFMISCSGNPDCPMSAQFGWSLVAATYAQTGQLRRFFHTWSTSHQMPKAAATVDWLLAQPAVKAALDTRQTPPTRWAVWEPVTYATGDGSADDE